MPAPIFKLPPAPTKAAQSQQAVFKAYVNSHPSMRPYANAIYKNASDYGVDPVYFASLLWKESFAAAKASGQDPSKIISPTGAGVGLGQINPNHVGSAVPWAPGQTITRAMLDDPAFSLHYSAYLFSQGVQKYGSYDAAYKQFYNPGYTGSVFQDVPKKYVPTTTARSPVETAQRAGETAQAKAALGAETWAVYVGNKLKFVTTSNRADGSPNPPKNTLKIWDQPLTKSAFLQQQSGIQDDWLAYTGKRPSFAQAAQEIKLGWSQFQRRDFLVKQPGFVGSPVWRQNAPTLRNVYQSIFGADAKDNVDAFKYAIANSLTDSGFADYLRNQKSYTTSMEFKQNTASLTNVFQSVWGTPGQADMGTIQQAALHGYDQNTFAAYLRSQPNYQASPEYLSKATALLDSLGMLTGAPATLVPGTPSQGAAGQTMPTDPRAAAAAIPHGINLVPGPSQAWTPPTGQPFTTPAGEPQLGG